MYLFTKQVCHHLPQLWFVQQPNGSTIKTRTPCTCSGICYLWQFEFTSVWNGSLVGGLVLCALHAHWMLHTDNPRPKQHKNHGNSLTTIQAHKQAHLLLQSFGDCCVGMPQQVCIPNDIHSITAVLCIAMQDHQQYCKQWLTT